MKVLTLIFSLLIPTLVLAQEPQASFLDVSIKIFTPVPKVESGSSAPPDIAVSLEQVHLAEARFIPMMLRYRMEASGLFGAVRVLPVIDNGAQLMIEGSITYSDPNRLQLQIRAQDSSGRIWLDQEYSGNAVKATMLSEDPLLSEDFASVYSAILKDINNILTSFSETDKQAIATLSLLRYGSALVPTAFADYLSSDEQGLFSITRLPASNDPVLERIRRIREREYLFIDVVDQEYRTFFSDIKPVYDMWRDFRREETESADSFISRETAQAKTFSRGSYMALQQSYNNFRWAKLQNLYLDELTEGFANEVAPTEIELSDSLYHLTGTLEQQYREWRSILAQLYELETQ